LVVVVDSLVGLAPLANLVFLDWETLVESKEVMFFDYLVFLDWETFLESKEVMFFDYLVFLDDDWETLVEW
jgi:hypothetical protein